MIKYSWLYRNFFIIYVALLCLGNSSLSAATAATNEGIYQTDTLDFVPPVHRVRIRNIFYQMMGDVSVTLRRDIAPHEKQVTLLSETCLLWFKTDGSAEAIFADRGRDDIRIEKTIIPLTNRNIFRASDRKNYQANRIKDIQETIGKLSAPTGPAAIARFFSLLAEVNKEFSTVMEIIADRRKAIEAKMMSHPLPILEEVIGRPSDPSKPEEPIVKYVEEHIDDGEGAAIDYLVMRMRDATLQSKLEEAVAIYPLVYTENDPCRCCLLSICPHLTRKIRRINPTATIMPIVVATSIFHEKSVGNARKLALRYHYPWWKPVGLFPWLPVTTVTQETGADAEDGDDVSPPPPTSLYLYHMPSREIFNAIHEAETAMALALPSVAVAPGGEVAVPPPAAAGAGAGSVASDPPSRRRGKASLSTGAAGAGFASAAASLPSSAIGAPSSVSAALGASPSHAASTLSMAAAARSADAQEAQELEQALAESIHP